MLHRNEGSSRVTIVKKYSNRRLYDTELSRYITLDELADTVRRGVDVQVVDAKTGQDLTQATLTQLILEGPAAKLLPVPLLRRLLRMPDDAIGEFFSKYVTWTLDLYLAGRSGAERVAPYFPFANLPLQATDAVLRMFGGGSRNVSPPPPMYAPEPEPAPAPDSSGREELAELRRELEALKVAVRGGASGSEKSSA